MTDVQNQDGQSRQQKSATEEMNKAEATAKNANMTDESTDTK